MIHIGIIGGAGYAGGELCRILLNHPEADLVFVNSINNAGKLLTDIHGGLFDETDLCFTEEMPFEQADVVFVCSEYGKSNQFLSEHYIPADVHIIDMTQDFSPTEEHNDYVYGLPELNRPQIINASHLTNPGDLSTGVLLGLLPLAEAGLLHCDISVHSIVGTSGHSESNPLKGWKSQLKDGMSILQSFDQEQLTETMHSLTSLQPDFVGNLDWISYRGGFPRGIFTTEIMTCNTPMDEIAGYYRDFYSEASFTHYSDEPLDIRQVVNTNKCLIHAERHRDKLIVTTCIDNLLKGSAGQAIQNMNLMFGFEETTGLRLKASVF